MKTRKKVKQHKMIIHLSNKCSCHRTLVLVLAPGRSSSSSTRRHTCTSTGTGSASEPERSHSSVYEQSHFTAMQICTDDRLNTIFYLNQLAALLPRMNSQI